MAGDSRFEGRERIHYTKDQLLQLREIVDVPEDILKIRREIDVELFGEEEQSWTRGDHNVQTQPQIRHYEPDNRDWCRPGQTAVEERSWIADRENKEFHGANQFNHAQASLSQGERTFIGVKILKETRSKKKKEKAVEFLSSSFDLSPMEFRFREGKLKEPPFFPSPPPPPLPSANLITRQATRGSERSDSSTEALEKELKEKIKQEIVNLLTRRAMQGAERSDSSTVALEKELKEEIENIFTTRAMIERSACRIEALVKELKEETIKEEILVSRMAQRRLIEEQARREMETEREILRMEHFSKVELPVDKPAQKAWNCSLCNVSAASKEHLDEHLKGKRHFRKSARCPLSENLTKPIEVELPVDKPAQKAWSCSLCNVSVASKEHLDEHLKGKQHFLESARRLLSENLTKPTEVQLPVDIPAQKAWSCSLSHISAPSKEHLDEGKHDLLKSAQRLPGKNSTEPTEVEFPAHKPSNTLKTEELKLSAPAQKCWSCAFCHVNASSAEQLNEHLRGKKHRAKTSAMLMSSNDDKCESSNVTSMAEHGRTST